jgi:hypothetical protein
VELLEPKYSPWTVRKLLIVAGWFVGRMVLKMGPFQHGVSGNKPVELHE